MDLTGLKNIPLFQPLQVQDIEYLLRISSLRNYPPGTIIFTEGDESDHLFVVIEGQIDIIKSLGSEVERLVNTLKKDDYLGEMSIVSSERKRTASAITRTGVQVMEIPVNEFEQMIRGNPNLAFDLMKVMVNRLRETELLAIDDLKMKNRQLMESLEELKAAQAQLIAKEKMEFELATARRIQESMLPEKIPSLPGWSLLAHWQPARAVSGDFYDIFPLNDGRLAIILGDVSDKGVPAALIMTVTRSMLRASAVNVSSPAELLERVNNLLCLDVPMGMFVTCHVSFLDLQSGSISYASAGHCRPLLRREGKVQELSCRGIVLGVMPDATYPNYELNLQPGDGLLLYSDGLFEAHNLDGKDFGLQTVQEVFATGQQPIEKLLDRLFIFTGSPHDLEDDITLVFLEKAAR